MKLEKIEHKHTLTNILKVALFSLFLLLPFIAIGSRCLYIICNKNAKDSYYGITINETQLTLIDNNNLPSINDKIHFKGVSGETVINNTNKNIYFTNPKNIYVQPYSETIITNINNSSYFQCTYFGAINYIVFYNSENVQSQVVSLTQYTFEFDFTLVDYQLNNITWEDGFNGYMYKYEYNKYSYLDNAFEYSFKDLENQTWFNWTKNTPLYNGVNSMATGLGINNNVISMIITYWLILTTIYIIIDIVINLYTLITHIISGRKAT